MNYQNSSFVKEWKAEQLRIIKRQRPDLSDDTILKKLDKIIEKNLQTKECYIHNNYKDDFNVKTNILTLYDWIYKNTPIVAGNGTFFYNQEQCNSPMTDLVFGRYDARKAYKDKMFEVGEIKGKDSYEFHHLDMLQMEAKVSLNSIYGATAAATFQLFNIYTAASTTGTAQSLISTTAVGMEAFLANNAVFKSIDECILFIERTCILEYKLPKQGISFNIPIEKVLMKLADTFEKWEDEYEDILYDTLTNLSQEELAKVYYKNNLYEFCNNEKIQGLIIEVFNHTDEFKNPYKPPKDAKMYIETFWEYLKEYVYYPYLYTTEIKRIKQDKRKAIVVIDTDSRRIIWSRIAVMLYKKISLIDGESLRAHNTKFI